MTKTATIYHRDGKTAQDLEPNAAASKVQNSRGEWSFHKPPPPGWESEIPKYRAPRDVQPSPKARYRSEPPFATSFSTDVWQYGAELVKAGQVIETKAWPHPSFHPLNYSAARVLEFFNSRQKSRLPVSPWHGQGIRLDDGMSGAPIVHVSPPQLQPIQTAPARA